MAIIFPARLKRVVIGTTRSCRWLGRIRPNFATKWNDHWRSRIYFTSHRLVHFETRSAKRRLRSKIEANLRTFWPCVKFNGGISKSLFVRDHKPIHWCTFDGCSSAVWEIRFWVAKKKRWKAAVKCEAY